MILVTGSSGFVGRYLVMEAERRNISTRRALRSAGSREAGESTTAVGNIGPATNWRTALEDIGVVIHCAARAHVMREMEADALSAYRQANVEGSRRLAQQAAEMSVRRLIYVSSVKVNGEQSVPGAPFVSSDPPAPEDPYGISKWEAEQALWEVSAKTGIEVVVIRPPLVYGPGVKGNFLRLLQLVAHGVPLPLAAVSNRRSLVGLENLADLLIRCVDHPAAAGQTFLVSDGKDLSTPELIDTLARMMNKSPRLLPVPASWLRMAAWITSKHAEANRLLGSLQVDNVHTCELLGWTPPASVNDGLQEMVNWFMTQC